MANWTGDDHARLQRLSAAVRDPEFHNLTNQEQLELKRALEDMVYRHTNFLLEGLRNVK